MPVLPEDDPLAEAVQGAVRQGDLPALRRLLDDHPELASVRLESAACRTSRTLLFAGPHAETPLHWAASSDDVAVMDALLDAGGDIEAPGSVLGGGTPLQDAVAFGQRRAAHRLVERGARTTLWQAAGLGLRDRVEAAFAGGGPGSRGGGGSRQDSLTRRRPPGCDGARGPPRRRRSGAAAQPRGARSAAGRALAPPPVTYDRRRYAARAAAPCRQDAEVGEVLHAPGRVVDTGTEQARGWADARALRADRFERRGAARKRAGVDRAPGREPVRRATRGGRLVPGAGSTWAMRRAAPVRAAAAWLVRCTSKLV